MRKPKKPKPMRTITLINLSQTWRPSDTLMADLTTYCNELASKWQRDAVQIAISNQDQRTGWRVYVLDEAGADEVGVAGYHTTHWRTPVGKVFVSVCEAVAMAIEGVITHELAEMIVDPLARTTVAMPDGKRIALEVCDPVQDELYLVGQTMCSNWVYPAYFDSNAAAPYDRLGSVTAPFGVTAGGYQIIDGAWVMPRAATVKMRCIGRVAKWAQPKKAKQ
jgi:hypothetical protein